MDNATNPIDAINALVNQPPVPTVRWIYCPSCHHIEEHDMALSVPGAACPACKSAIRRIPCPSLTAAYSRKALNQTTLSEVGKQPETNVVAGNGDTTMNQKQAESRMSRTPPVDLPAPVAPKKRMKIMKEPAQPAAEPTLETIKPPEAPSEIPTALANAQPVIPEAESTGKTEAQAIREQATANLIAKHRLNQADFTRIGIGEVLSLGFTVWHETAEGNRVPSYCFMELTDDPKSFREVLNEARKADGNVTIDCARVTALPDEIRPVVWQGELVASLRDGKRAWAVLARSKVHLGAKVTKSGRLVWAVMGNA